jgi:hypothetical protein
MRLEGRTDEGKMPKLEEPVTLFFFAMTTSPSLIERHLERITINELFDLYSNDGFLS